MDDLVRLARLAWETQDWVGAAALYEQLAIRAPDDPRAGAWWYDAALAHKFLRNWPEAYRLGIRASAASARGAQDPAFWNLGIAATIMRDWPTARDAWEGYGLEVPPGAGPIDGDYGRACVRLSGQEVVWVRRLCPTRARVMSVPFDLSRRYGEIVVHDGEPKGHREVGDRTYTVFNELVLFEPSEVPTLAVTVTAAAQVDVDALADMLAADGFGFEPLGNGQVLCTCCSEGTLTQESVVLSGDQRCLIAAPLDRAEAILTAWQAPGARTWVNLHAAIGE